MQAIFRLIEHDRARRIHDLVGDFKAAMRRQAVQENGVRRGLHHQPVVHLIAARKVSSRFGLFVLLAHAGPDVRVNGLRAGDGFFRLSEQLDLAAASPLPRAALRCDDFGVRLVTLRRGDAHLRAQPRAGDHQRMAHVIAVADVGELQSAHAAEFLLAA